MAEYSPIPDKNTLIRAFNKHFFEFLDDIISVVRENEEIIYAKQSFETFKRANPTLIIKIWFKHIYFPYQEVVHRGDISFICEKDFNQDLEGLSNSQEIMEVIDKLRHPIKNMSVKNKAHTMKFIQNLSKLSEMYADAIK
jgi:hypothetical protein